MQDTFETLTHCPVCQAGPLVPWDAPAKLDQCRSCDSIVDNPRLDAASISAFYSRAGQYDHWLSALEARTAMWARRFRLLAPWLGDKGSILDVGAGVGQFLSHAKAAGLSVDGTELSPVARKEAMERFGITLRAGQLEDLSLEGSSYESLTMFHVLEHVPYPGMTLAECFRLLKPGGHIVVAVPNEVDAITALFHRATGLLRSQGRGLRGIRTLAIAPQLKEVHLTRFTMATLAKGLEKAGFEVVERTIDPHLPPTGWRGILATLTWKTSLLTWKALGWNPYPTLLVVGRKPLR